LIDTPKEDRMSTIKVSELAYVRVQVPDLDLAEKFLLDFGFVAAQREEGRRYYRTTDPSPYCYVVESGPRRFLGFAFHAKSAADLQKIAQAHGKPVEPIEAPGGGKRVRLQEPNGYAVDVVFGIEPVERLAIQRHTLNDGARPLGRAGVLLRLPKGAPTPLKRLAHVVLGTPNAAETIAWFRDELGAIISDEIVAGPERKTIGAFMRVDDGDNYVDHHSLFVIGAPEAGLHHISFEAQDVDAVMADHHYLQTRGYTHIWGIGRHLLGSQIFDYWRDPFGYAHEHWTDSDRLNASTPSNTWDVREGLVTQWGEETPESFRKAVP
jgi:catechol 2,3-dioxygenase-like lactoylglutathione lyase family enzyme